MNNRSFAFVLVGVLIFVSLLLSSASASPSTQAATFSDNFNRADGGAGYPWSGGNVSGNELTAGLSVFPRINILDVSFQAALDYRVTHAATLGGLFAVGSGTTNVSCGPVAISGNWYFRVWDHHTNTTDESALGVGSGSPVSGLIEMYYDVGTGTVLCYWNGAHGMTMPGTQSGFSQIGYNVTAASAGEVAADNFSFSGGLYDPTVTPVGPTHTPTATPYLRLCDKPGVIINGCFDNALNEWETGGMVWDIERARNYPVATELPSGSARSIKAFNPLWTNIIEQKFFIYYPGTYSMVGAIKRNSNFTNFVDCGVCWTGALFGVANCLINYWSFGPILDDLYHTFNKTVDLYTYPGMAAEYELVCRDGDIFGGGIGIDYSLDDFQVWNMDDDRVTPTGFVTPYPGLIGTPTPTPTVLYFCSGLPCTATPAATKTLLPYDNDLLLTPLPVSTSRPTFTPYSTPPIVTYTPRPTNTSVPLPTAPAGSPTYTPGPTYTPVPLEATPGGISGPGSMGPAATSVAVITNSLQMPLDNLDVVRRAAAVPGAIGEGLDSPNMDVTSMVTNTQAGRNYLDQLGFGPYINKLLTVLGACIIVSGLLFLLSKLNVGL